MALLGDQYLTAAQFRSLEANGLDLTDWSDAQLDELLAASSRMVDSYVNQTFALTKYSDERLVWHLQSHRVYPVNHPILFAVELRLYFTQQSVAVFNAGALFNHPREDYIALTSFALQPQISILPALIGTGLRQIVAGATYIAGYGTPVAAMSDGTPPVPVTLQEAVVQITTTSVGAGIDVAETWDVSDASPFAVDQLIRLGTEDAFVEAVDDVSVPNNISVLRNGTNTAHAIGTAINIYQTAAPNDVATAVWLTAAHLIGQQGLRAEGMTGLRQAVIGSYSISIGGDASSAGMPFVPEAAKEILRAYRKIRIQGG
jgi:hypothetical protein